MRKFSGIVLALTLASLFGLLALVTSIDAKLRAEAQAEAALWDPQPVLSVVP